MNEQTGNTTKRSANTAPAPQRFDRLVLRWIFPRSLGGGRALSGGRISVGRGEQCAIRVEEASISRQHCEIYRDGPVFAIRDLGSTNGTYLNGKRVEHGAIACGDVLRIGEVVGLVDAADAPLEVPRVEEIATDLYGGELLARIVEPARRAATSELPIVLVGETGTGKERVARAIHEWSARKSGFHAINCAALPPNLAEAELFGYRKGAFTGADRPSLGRLRAAQTGTLLLDEIADLSLATQAKLLRVIEERRVIPLGESEGVPFAARIVAATQRPLEELVNERTFRRDLRARLSGLSIQLPPLRERVVDIVPLFLHFLHVHSGGTPPDLEAKLAEELMLQAWPDNVRELELVARGLLALQGSEPVLKRSFLSEVQTRSDAGRADVAPGPALPTRKAHDLHHFVQALRESGGNVAAAASKLGFSRQRAYRLMNGATAAELIGRSELEGEGVDGRVAE